MSCCCAQVLTGLKPHACCHYVEAVRERSLTWRVSPTVPCSRADRLAFRPKDQIRHRSFPPSQKRARMYEHIESLQSGGEREIRITGVLGLNVSPVRRYDKIFKFLRRQRLSSLGDDPLVHLLHRSGGRIDNWNVAASRSRFSLRGNHLTMRS